jgi:hypothetical protein
MKNTVKQEPVYFEHHYYLASEPVEKHKRVVKSKEEIVKAYAEKHGFAGVHAKPWTKEDTAKLNATLRKAGHPEV